MHTREDNDCVSDACPHIVARMAFLTRRKPCSLLPLARGWSWFSWVAFTTHAEWSFLSLNSLKKIELLVKSCQIRQSTHMPTAGHALCCLQLAARSSCPTSDQGREKVLLGRRAFFFCWQNWQAAGPTIRAWPGGGRRTVSSEGLGGMDRTVKNTIKPF